MRQIQNTLRDCVIYSNLSVMDVLAVFTIPLHPIVHNLALLTITPIYRKAIVKYSTSVRIGRK
ncbi:hypothetical protein PRIPAC_79142, partial [Pristionchus pacificus]|uniref:Uncharacterized protein n=1 Tax=Pristionchus pacificus TaxID=54126 RepID=A0A2A6CMG8_PRIPA